MKAYIVGILLFLIGMGMLYYDSGYGIVISIIGLCVILYNEMEHW